MAEPRRGAARSPAWQPALLVAVWLVALWLAAACKPEVSTAPLGLGPLALAEARAPAPSKTTPPSKPARRAKTRTAVVEAAEESAPEEPATAGEATPAPAEAATQAQDAPAAAAKVEFKGMYSGTDVAVFRLDGMPDREQKDDRAKIRIEADGSDAILIVIINTDNGQDMCELPASVKGNVATLSGAESCFTSEDDDSVSDMFTTGQATLKDDRLTFHAEGELTVIVGDQTLSGDLSYSFEGKRQ